MNNYTYYTINITHDYNIYNSSNINIIITHIVKYNQLIPLSKFVIFVVFIILISFGTPGVIPVEIIISAVQSRPFGKPSDIIIVYAFRHFKKTAVMYSYMLMYFAPKGLADRHISDTHR